MQYLYARFPGFLHGGHGIGQHLIGIHYAFHCRMEHPAFRGEIVLEFN